MRLPLATCIPGPARLTSPRNPNSPWGWGLEWPSVPLPRNQTPALLALKMVRRVQSVEAPNPAQTRLSRYEITDPFLRFHFEFMHPHPDLIETKRIGRLMEIITSRFEAYAGKSGYEELARRYLTRLGDAGFTAGADGKSSCLPEQALPYFPPLRASQSMDRAN